MRIVVFGTGAVGGYFGARLAQAGEDVTFIARGEHLHAMQVHGLRVDSPEGDIFLPQVQVTDNLQQVGEVDFILLGVKAWQVKEAARQMAPLVGEMTSVIPLQNGVDAPAQLSALLGPEAVLGGLCQISAYRAGPGHICHAGIKPLIAFGELDGSTSQRVELLRKLFEQAGVNAETPPSILSAMWRKFLLIASISGIGAVTRVPLGETRSVPETRSMLLTAMLEIEALANKRGISLARDVVAKTMDFVDTMPPTVIPSMQRDIMKGQPSELEAQNGAVVRMGHESDCPTPTHTFIYAALLPQERKAVQGIQRGE